MFPCGEWCHVVLWQKLKQVQLCLLDTSASGPLSGRTDRHRHLLSHMCCVLWCIHIIVLQLILHYGVDQGWPGICPWITRLRWGARCKALSCYFLEFVGRGQPNASENQCQHCNRALSNTGAQVHPFKIIATAVSKPSTICTGVISFYQGER